MSKHKALNAPELNNMDAKTFTFERDDLLTLIAALYVLEEQLEKGNSYSGYHLGERADNVFEIDGYGYPSIGEVEALRERINGL